MTNPNRPPRPGQPRRPANSGRPGRPERPTVGRASTTGNGAWGRQPGNGTPGTPGANGRPTRAASQRIGSPAGHPPRGTTGRTGQPRRPAAAVRDGRGGRPAPASRPTRRPVGKQDAPGKGLAGYLGSDFLANKRNLLIIGAIVLVLVIIIAAVASQRSSSTNAASTVTAITSTTVQGENRTVAPDAEGTNPKAVTPDFSQLSMDPSTDPNAKAYFAALKKGGIPVQEGLETPLLGMGYTHCHATTQNDRQSAEMQDIMLETLVQMTPGVNKAKAKKVVYSAADKHLCPSLKSRQ